MIDNYEHYITRNIVAFYKRRLLAPICYILLLLHKNKCGMTFQQIEINFSENL